MPTTTEVDKEAPLNLLPVSPIILKLLPLVSTIKAHFPENDLVFTSSTSPDSNNLFSV
jgi:hypothetical protein